MAKIIFTTEILTPQEDFLIESCHHEITETSRYQFFTKLKILKIDSSWYAIVTLEPDNILKRKKRKKRKIKILRSKILENILWDASEFVYSHSETHSLKDEESLSSSVNVEKFDFDLLSYVYAPLYE